MIEISQIYANLFKNLIKINIFKIDKWSENILKFLIFFNIIIKN